MITIVNYPVLASRKYSIGFPAFISQLTKRKSEMSHVRQYQNDDDENEENDDDDYLISRSQDGIYMHIRWMIAICW